MPIDPAIIRLVPSILTAGLFALLALAALIPGELPPFSYLVSALDMLNFVAHEVGHPVFGFLGNWMCVAGGTIGQLVFPVYVAIAELRKPRVIREGFPVGDPRLSFGLFWIGLNLTGISRYMGDAIDRKLPLFHPAMLFGETNVGHDWEYLLGSLGLLGAAKPLAFLVFTGSLAFYLLAALNAFFPMQMVVRWAAAWVLGRGSEGKA